MDSAHFTIADIQSGLERGDFSPEELRHHYRLKIGHRNGDLHVYLSEAKGDQSPTDGLLKGVTFALKDNMMVKGSVTTAGSKILEHYTSAYDATAAQKLRESGAVLLGKTNLDEFAMGSSTENSAFGPTKNPHDQTRVSGGSSGGSAAAVAADLAVFALGSDTGGSIRQPAAFCGVVGLKPSYGRVSRHGLIAMASSLDQIGPITKNVRDAATVLNLIAGHDQFDSTTAKGEVPDFSESLEQPVKGLTVGVPREFFDSGLDSEVREKVEQSMSRLESLGCRLREVSLPHSRYALATYYIIMPSEVSSNLARLDGIRYGHSTREASNLFEVYTKSRAESFGAEAKRRIMLGTYALSSGYYDAYYLKAQKVRALIRKDFDQAFEQVDVIVGPTTPTTAFLIGDKTGDPLAMYLSDIYTVPVNLAGIPAISIPCGRGASSQMPVGLQVIGKYFDEATILRVAHQLERAISYPSI